MADTPVEPKPEEPEVVSPSSAHSSKDETEEEDDVHMSTLHYIKTSVRSHLAYSGIVSFVAALLGGGLAGYAWNAVVQRWLDDTVYAPGVDGRLSSIDPDVKPEDISACNDYVDPICVPQEETSVLTRTWLGCLLFGVLGAIEGVFLVSWIHNTVSHIVNPDAHTFSKPEKARLEKLHKHMRSVIHDKSKSTTTFALLNVGFALPLLVFLVAFFVVGLVCREIVKSIAYKRAPRTRPTEKELGVTMGPMWLAPGNNNCRRFVVPECTDKAIATGATAMVAHTLTWQGFVVVYVLTVVVLRAIRMVRVVVFEETYLMGYEDTRTHIKIKTKPKKSSAGVAILRLESDTNKDRESS